MEGDTGQMLRACFLRVRGKPGAAARFDGEGKGSGAGEPREVNPQSM